MRRAVEVASEFLKLCLIFAVFGMVGAYLGAPL